MACTHGAQGLTAGPTSAVVADQRSLCSDWRNDKSVPEHFQISAKYHLSLEHIHFQSLCYIIKSGFEVVTHMDFSPFARLSPELRNKIYEHVFCSSNRFRVSLGPASGPNNAQSPLTRTCRQMRQESLHMYLANTRFSAHLDDGPITPLIRWFEAIGPEAIALLPQVAVFDLHDSQLELLSRLGAEMRQAGEADGWSWIYQPINADTMGHVSVDAVKYVKPLQDALKKLGLDLRMHGFIRCQGQSELRDLVFVIMEALEE